MRTLALLCALLFAVPLPAVAQSALPDTPRLTLAPFTGVRVPHGGGLAGISVPSGDFVVKQERSGSPLLGAEARLRLSRPLSLVGAGVYSRGGDVQLFPRDTGFAQAREWIARSEGPMWFGKLALAARFDAPPSLTDTRRRPSTELFAGAGVVRDMGALHPALNLGFEGVLPIARGVEFTLGLEDYLTFWDKSKVGPTLGEIAEIFQTEEVDAVDLLYSTSNILLLRIGLALHPW